MARAPRHEDGAEATPMLYADANSAALMPQAIIDTMARWCNRGNPADTHSSAKEARRLLEKFRHYIAEECDNFVPVFDEEYNHHDEYSDGQNYEHDRICCHDRIVYCLRYRNDFEDCGICNKRGNYSNYYGRKIFDDAE